MMAAAALSRVRATCLVDCVQQRGGRRWLELHHTQLEGGGDVRAEGCR